MNKIRWSVVVPESTDKALRTYLVNNSSMKKGAISDFVDKAVQAYLFEQVTNTVKERNTQYEQDDILTAIDEAVSKH